jgi:uncharacterized protein YggU (UPF0235/DUF167 family)
VPDAYRVFPGGIDIFIRLTPKSSRDALGGLFQAQDKVYFQARVRSVPEDGRANQALIELLSGELGVPRSTLSLVSGHTARLKTVRIEGTGQALERAVAALVERKP